MCIPFCVIWVHFHSLISGWMRRLNERLSSRGKEVCVQLMSETHYGPADFQWTLSLADIDTVSDTAVLAAYFSSLAPSAVLDVWRSVIIPVAREHYHFLCPGLFAAVKNHVCNKFTIPEINSKLGVKIMVVRWSEDYQKYVWTTGY